MAKRVTLLIMACLLLIPTTAVFSDVLVGPQINIDIWQFLNGSECHPLGRQFIANGPDGYVPLYKTPGDSSYIRRIENYPLTDRDNPWIKVDEDRFDSVSVQDLYYPDDHALFTIDQTYNRNGESWGQINQYMIPYGRLNGWVRMDHLLAPYGSSSFFDEKQREFYTFKGDLNTLAADEVFLFNWPAGPRFGRVPIEAYFSADYAWMDDQGREWILNTPGSSRPGNNKWICFSDPANPDPFNGVVYYPFPAVWIDPNPPARLVSNTLISLIVSVAVLIIATYLLLRRFWTRGKTQTALP